MSTPQGLYVPNGKIRFEEELMIWGPIPLQIKISTDDTDGALFIFEHAGIAKFGPLRHFHHEQDEWFYAIKGNFAFEVGEERFTLRPSDSLSVPRMVPHVWSYIGDDPGTLLVAIQPAGSFEAFFRESCEMNRLPTPEVEDRMHAAHGMKIVGPSLEVD